MQTAHGTTQTARAIAGSPQPPGWMMKMRVVGWHMTQLPWILPSGDPAPPTTEVLLQSPICQIIRLEGVKKRFLEEIMVRTRGCHYIPLETSARRMTSLVRGYHKGMRSTTSNLSPGEVKGECVSERKQKHSEFLRMFLIAWEYKAATHQHSFPHSFPGRWE